MKKPFDFWQDHSETFLIMANLWDKRKAIDHPDGYGRKTGDCGDTVSIYLNLIDGIISAVHFELDGCINTNACCNTLAHLVKGKNADECWQITPDDIINTLETLPADHYHCAELTVGTFYLALADCRGGKI